MCGRVEPRDGNEVNGQAMRRQSRDRARVAMRRHCHERASIAKALFGSVVQRLGAVLSGWVTRCEAVAMN